MGRSVYFFLGFVIAGPGYSVFSAYPTGTRGMSQVHCIVGFPSFCALTLSHGPTGLRSGETPLVSIDLLLSLNDFLLNVGGDQASCSPEAAAVGTDTERCARGGVTGWWVSAEALSAGARGQTDGLRLDAQRVLLVSEDEGMWSC